MGIAVSNVGNLYATHDSYLGGFVLYETGDTESWNDRWIYSNLFGPSPIILGPPGLDFDENGYLYAINPDLDIVEKFVNDTVVATIEDKGLNSTTSDNLSDIAVNKSGDIYVTDSGKDKVMIFKPHS